MQFLPFTCGPAALIQLLQAEGIEISNSLAEQISIWRTANTIFSGDGPPGCSAEGLALAASERGVPLDVFLSHDGFDLTDTVRAQKKKSLIRLAITEQRRLLRQRGVAIRRFDVSNRRFKSKLARANHFIVLVRQSYVSNLLDYHWIYARRRNDDEVLVYDPYLTKYKNLKHDIDRVDGRLLMTFDDLLRRSSPNRGRDRCWLF